MEPRDDDWKLRLDWLDFKIINHTFRTDGRKTFGVGSNFFLQMLSDRPSVRYEIMFWFITRYFHQ